VLAVVVVTALIALTNLELQAAAIVKALALHRPVLVSGKGMILVIPALELLTGASVPLASAKGGRLARQLPHHLLDARERGGQVPFPADRALQTLAFDHALDTLPSPGVLHDPRGELLLGADVASRCDRGHDGSKRQQQMHRSQ
jgi:hypothetical protein